MVKQIAQMILQSKIIPSILMILGIILVFEIGHRLGRAEGRIFEMLKFETHMMKHMDIEKEIFSPAKEITAPDFNDDVP